MSSNNKKYDSNKTFLNTHNVMFGFAIMFLIIAIVGLISLSGVQTGSSNTSGCGSAIQSSTGGQQDGQINPTAEVVAEFFIVLFTVLGVAMITYVMTIKGAAKKLVEANQNYAAILINGNKGISEQDIKGAEKEQLMHLVSDVGLPSNTIQMGLQAIKNTKNSTMQYAARKSQPLKKPPTADDKDDKEDKEDDDNDS